MSFTTSNDSTENNSDNKTFNSKTVNDYIQHFYDDNPFTNGLGVEIRSINDGKVAVALKIHHEHTNVYGIAHGGVIMSLCDMAMGAACLSLHQKVVTLDFNINIIKSIPENNTAFVKSNIIHNGRSTIVAEAEVYNNEQQLCAKSRGTFFVIGKIDS